MSTNLGRKTTSLPASQMKLTFGNTKKVDTADADTQTDVEELTFELSMI